MVCYLPSSSLAIFRNEYFAQIWTSKCKYNILAVSYFWVVYRISLNYMYAFITYICISFSIQRMRSMEVKYLDNCQGYGKTNPKYKDLGDKSELQSKRVKIHKDGGPLCNLTLENSTQRSRTTNNSNDSNCFEIMNFKNIYWVQVVQITVASWYG